MRASDSQAERKQRRRSPRSIRKNWHSECMQMCYWMTVSVIQASPQWQARNWSSCSNCWCLINSRWWLTEKGNRKPMLWWLQTSSIRIKYSKANLNILQRNWKSIPEVIPPYQASRQWCLLQGHYPSLVDKRQNIQVWFQSEIDHRQLCSWKRVQQPLSSHEWWWKPRILQNIKKLDPMKWVSPSRQHTRHGSKTLAALPPAIETNNSFEAISDVTTPLAILGHTPPHVRSPPKVSKKHHAEM